MTPARSASPVKLLALAAALLAGLGGCDGSSEPATAPQSGPSALTAGTTALPLVFRYVSTGGPHSCGVTTDHRAYCWGTNHLGQLGDGTNIPRYVPTPVTGGLRFRNVRVGTYHTCGVTTDGRAY